MPRNEIFRTRTIWTFAGAGWGTLVGLVVALQTAGFLAGVGWLFVFGDDPWPEAADWVLIGSAVLAFLVPFVLVTWLGRRLGIAFEAENRQRLRTRRRGWLVFGMAASGLALGAAMAGAGMLTERARRADREAAAHQLEQLVVISHRIDGVELHAGDPPAVQAEIGMEGARAGEYVLDWRLRETTYDSTLAVGSRALTLPPRAAEEVVAIDTAQVRVAYHRLVLDGAGGVLVDEDVEVTFTLRPVLTPDERARLPDEAIRDLDSGESDLVSVETVTVPVRFEIR